MNTFGEFSPEEIDSEVDTIYKELETEGYTRPRYVAPPQEAPSPDISDSNTVETPQAPLQTPQQPDSQLMPASESMGAADYLFDVARGALRGGLGAVESTADLLAFGALPNEFLTGNIDRPKSVVGGLAEGATEFAVGFIPAFRVINMAGKAGKLAKAGSIGKWLQKSQIGRGAVAGAVADFTVFDEHEERLSNLIQQIPALENPVTEFLAADKDDGLLEGRMKNVLEGAAIGTAVDGIILGIKALKKARGMAEAGDAKGAQEALDSAGKDIQLKLQEGEDVTTGGLRPFTEAFVVDFDAQAKAARSEMPYGVSGYAIPLPSSTTKLLGELSSRSKSEMGEAQSPVSAKALLQSMLDGWDEVTTNTKKMWSEAVAAGNKSDFLQTNKQKAERLGTEGLQPGESRLLERETYRAKLGRMDEAQVDQMLGGLRQLTESVLSLNADNLAKTQVFRGGSGVRSAYYPSFDKIILGARYDGDKLFHTPIHEVVHALTSRQIDLNIPGLDRLKGANFLNKIQEAKNNPDVVQPLKDLIDSYTTSAERLGVDQTIFGKKTKKGARRYGTAGAEPDLTVKKGVAYGFGNLDEFTAQAISSPGFQVQLASIRLDSGKSAFRALTDAIADLLGMDIDKTMLEKVLRETAELAGTPVSRGGTKEGLSSGASRAANDVVQQAPAPDVLPSVKARFDEYLKIYEKNPDDLQALAKAFMDETDRPVFNLENFSTVEDAHKGALSLMKTFADTIERAKGEPRTNSVVTQDAIDFFRAHADKDFMARLNKDAVNARQADARVRAYYGVALAVNNQIGKHVDEFIKARDLLEQYPDDPALLKRYSENYLAATELQQKFGSLVFGYQTVRTGAGRTLNAFKQIKELTTLTEYAKAMMEQAGGKRDVEATLDKLHLIFKKHGAAGLAKQAPAGALDMHNELWINFLLSGPKTFAVNALGTGLNTVFRPIVSALGAQGMYLKTGDTSWKMVRDEYINTYGYMMDSFKEALELGLKAFRDGDSILQRSSSPLESGPAITSENVAALLKTDRDANPVLAGIADFFGNTVRIPSRILTGTDEFFKQINFRAAAKSKATIEALEALGEKSTDPQAVAEWVAARLDNIVMQDGRRYSKKAVRAQAVVEATNRFGRDGLDSLESADFINKYISDNWDPSKSSLADYAFDVAQEATFTRRGERNPLTGKAEIQLTLERFASNHPSLRLVVPFVTTPMNILKMVGQYTYGAAVLGLPGVKKMPFLMGERLRLARELASNDPMVVATAQGKLYMGLAITSTVVTAAAAGTITGGGPEDENEKKIKMATGWRPYSFKIGDTYISYQRLDPFATFLGLGADLYERSTAMKAQDDHPLQTAVAAMAVAFSKNITNKSYLAGIEQITDAFSQPERFVPKLLQNRVGSYVPAFIGQAVGGFGDDPYMREARDWYDAVLRRAPGLSRTTDPSRNILGEKVERPSIAPVIDYVNPIIVSRDKKDVVMQEIASLQHGFTQPRVIQDGGIDFTDYYNANGQTAYDRWLEATGEVRIGGKTLRQSLEGLVKSRRYQALSPTLSEDFDSPRTKEIRKVITAYRSMAKEKILREFPDLNRQLNTATRVKLALRRGESVEELLSQLRQ